MGVIVLLGGDGVSPREIDASRPRACGGGDESPSDREGSRRWGGEDSETEGCRLEGIDTGGELGISRADG